MEAAIGLNCSLSASERIHVRICAPIIVDVAIRIRLIVTLHECAVVAVIWLHIMVALCIGRNHRREQHECEDCFLHGECEFSQSFHILILVSGGSSVSAASTADFVYSLRAAFRR